MIDRNTPIPLYFQIAELVRGQIAAGTLARGDRLPSEHEFCVQYDVSRSVVRQALQSLSQDGLIGTARGRGAFVRERKVPIALTQRLDPLHDNMAKAGFRLTTKVLQQRLIDAPGHVAEHIGDAQAIFLERLRYADGQVLLVVQNYVSYKRLPALLRFRGLETVSLYDHIREQYGLIASTGKRMIEVREVEEETAGLLGLDVGSRALFNREVTRDQHGIVLEYYESWHHPDRTCLSIDVHRGHEDKR